MCFSSGVVAARGEVVECAGIFEAELQAMSEDGGSAGCTVEQRPHLFPLTPCVAVRSALLLAPPGQQARQAGAQEEERCRFGNWSTPCIS